MLEKFTLSTVAVLVAMSCSGCAEIPKQTTTYTKVGVTHEQAARDAYLCGGKNDRPYFTDQCMERKGYTIAQSQES